MDIPEYTDSNSLQAQIINYAVATIFDSLVESLPNDISNQIQRARLTERGVSLLNHLKYSRLKEIGRSDPETFKAQTVDLSDEEMEKLLLSDPDTEVERYVYEYQDEFMQLPILQKFQVTLLKGTEFLTPQQFLDVLQIGYIKLTKRSESLSRLLQKEYQEFSSNDTLSESESYDDNEYELYIEKSDFSAHVIQMYEDIKDTILAYIRAHIEGYSGVIPIPTPNNWNPKEVDFNSGRMKLSASVSQTAICISILAVDEELIIKDYRKLSKAFCNKFMFKPERGDNPICETDSFASVLKRTIEDKTREFLKKKPNNYDEIIKAIRSTVLEYVVSPN